MVKYSEIAEHRKKQCIHFYGSPLRYNLKCLLVRAIVDFHKTVISHGYEDDYRTLVEISSAGHTIARRMTELEYMAGGGQDVLYDDPIGDLFYGQLEDALQAIRQTNENEQHGTIVSEVLVRYVRRLSDEWYDLAVEMGKDLGMPEFAPQNEAEG